MFNVQRRGGVGYESVLRELERFEHELLNENRSMAMDLMVIEAKIRERFQQMEKQVGETCQQMSWDEQFNLESDSNLDDIQALVPQDLPLVRSLEEFRDSRRRKRVFETVGLAAILAVLTAAGVFGLASLLQLTLSWLA